MSVLIFGSRGICDKSPDWVNFAKLHQRPPTSPAPPTLGTSRNTQRPNSRKLHNVISPIPPPNFPQISRRPQLCELPKIPNIPKRPQRLRTSNNPQSPTFPTFFAQFPSIAQLSQPFRRWQLPQIPHFHNSPNTPNAPDVGNFRKFPVSLFSQLSQLSQRFQRSRLPDLAKRPPAPTPQAPPTFAMFRMSPNWGGRHKFHRAPNFPKRSQFPPQLSSTSRISQPPNAPNYISFFGGRFPWLQRSQHPPTFLNLPGPRIYLFPI